MAGVTPEEGRRVIGQLIYNQSNADRGTSLSIGLFKNTSGLGATSVLADITPITGGGYASIALADANWNVSAQGAVTYPSLITFTATGSAFDDIYGYYIFTTGTSPKLLHFEVDPNAPVAKADTESYTIDLSTIVGVT
jgi:hypothetical protein